MGAFISDMYSSIVEQVLEPKITDLAGKPSMKGSLLRRSFLCSIHSKYHFLRAAPSFFCLSSDVGYSFPSMQTAFTNDNAMNRLSPSPGHGVTSALGSAVG